MRSGPVLQGDGNISSLAVKIQGAMTPQTRRPTTRCLDNSWHVGVAWVILSMVYPRIFSADLNDLRLSASFGIED
jgi:hypothetical protein